MMAGPEELDRKSPCMGPAAVRLPLGAMRGVARPERRCCNGRQASAVPERRLTIAMREALKASGRDAATAFHAKRQSDLD